MNLRTLKFWLAPLVLGVVISACSEPTIGEEEARLFVEDWASSVEQTLRTEGARSAGSEALQSRIMAALRAEEEQDRGEMPFARLVQEVYGERDYSPRLVGDEGLTAAGQAIWEALQDLEAHQLDPGPYRIETILEALADLEVQKETIADFEGFQAQPVDREEALAWLVEQPVSAFTLEADQFEVLTRTLLEDSQKGSRMRGAIEEYQEKRSGLTVTSARLEERLANGFARYARDQRHFRIKEIFVHPRHWDRWNEQDLQKRGRRPDPDRGAFLARQIWRDAAHLTEAISAEQQDEIHQRNIKAALGEVLDSEDPGNVVARIPPRQPQYAGLVAEYKRYKAMVEAGGWETVRRENSLREGQSHPVVSDLKRRLRAESYFPEDVEITDLYDEDLTAAIRAYQETHQMAVTGRPHHLFWLSLNVPAERRLAQIGLNIKRWRDTNVDHDLRAYTFVNVPDFTVEVYKDGERILQHRTVVGDNNRSLNPLSGEMEYSNRTPTPMAAYIDRVIFNPYWNVTDRIRAVRILPEVRRSLENKYVSRLLSLYEEAQGPAEEPSQPRRVVAALRNLGSQGADMESDPAPEEVVDDGMSPEERAEALREARRQEALAKFTEVRRVQVRVEGSDSMESRRFFKIDQLEELRRQVYGEGEEAQARFRGRFPYLDWETGEVDVENTQMDNIPSWYEANGYDVVRIGNWEYVRMLPGPENALGDVKIIFPNYDNIYLHDTPAKSLFNEDIRGFSHGCIRVQNPLELSELLLELGGVEGTNIQAILRGGEYDPIFLREQIPVFLEYYTVRVDDQGRANFLADIYGYDSDALADDS